ncbi:MAG: hypothetical protein SFX18_18370 [Pirellulales bacterium]|nr:hypothetical protein [Pirellulales bacterium]
MKFSRVFLAAALFCSLVQNAPAVEMFTHFGREMDRLGFEPLNAVKRKYPGYRLPNGQRIPVQPAPGAHPWSWRGW